LIDAPLFSISWCRTIGPHQSPIRFKAWELSSAGSDLPPLAIFIAPENYRYHAASKVIGSQILWLSLFGNQPYCGSRVGVPSNHSTAELSICKGTGQRPNRTMWF